MIRILGTGEQDIAYAIDLLNSAQVVALPTETVYGLAGDATSVPAVSRIFSAKGRPGHNPLIVHVADITMAQSLGLFDDISLALAAAFWPGPLTLVLPLQPNTPIAPQVTPGGRTIALRQPAHPVFQSVLSAFGRPLAAPSANPSGMMSPTTAAHVCAGLGEVIPAVIDGGPARIGVESTVVQVSNGKIYLLRPGGIVRDVIGAAVGMDIVSGAPASEILASPGQLQSHYAPRASVRLNATHADAGEALLAFGPNEPAFTGPKINLSPDADLGQAAANLFAMMRQLDQADIKTIAVMPIPMIGIGEAINDRLKRAASER